MSSQRDASTHTLAFENLHNFRDISHLVNQSSEPKNTILRPGLFFRSARPDEATSADRQKLQHEYGIKTIIDLRTTTEHVNAAKKRDALVGRAQSAALPVSNDMMATPVKIPGIKYAEINLNGKGFERNLLWQLSYLNLAKVITYMTLGYRMNAISIIGKEVLKPRGLVGLGIETVEHSGPEINEFFKVLADDKSWPVLIHCTQGKDRTGLVVLLVLLLCGIDLDTITKDYVLSESELESEKEERMKEINSIGLGEEFSKCPSDFVPRITQHIEEKYGGIQDYLHHIGLEEEQLQKVRHRLLENPANIMCYQ